MSVEAMRSGPYQGRPGQTRTELVHYSCSCGAVFSLAATRVVNVDTDRDLAESAVAGNLNRGQCAYCGALAEVAIPYVLHHPQEERFVLVVPEGMRHRELALRSRLLEELGSATDAAVPEYVRSFQVVFGTDGLRQSLARPPAHVALRDELVAIQAELEERERAQAEAERLLAVRESQLAKRERAIEDQEESVTMREERLKERGEQVTRAEDEARQRSAEHQARIDNLEARLRLVEQREAAVAEREQALTARSRTLQEWEARLRSSGPAPAAEAPPVGLGESPETLVAPHPPDQAFGPLAMGTMPEEEISTELRRAQTVSLNPDAPEQTQRSKSLSADEAARVLAEVEDAEELSEADLIEEDELSADDLIEDEAAFVPGPDPALTSPVLAAHAASAPVAPPPAGATPVPTPVEQPSASPPPGQTSPSASSSSSPAPLATVESSSPPSLEETEPHPVEASAPPAPMPVRPEPPAHWVRSGDQTYHLVDEGDVYLLARVDTETATKVIGGGSDLWVQLHLAEEYPLIALTLVVDPSDEETEAVHFLLDIEEDEDRALLQILRRRFQARVLLYDEEYSLVDEVTFEPPREVNVAQVVDRATQELGAIPPGKLSPVQARARFRGDWDRLGKKRHPFTEDAYDEIASPAEAKLALGILAYWSEQDNHDYLVLVKSVPVDLLDTITRRILDGAVRYGLWLSRPLKERALALGLASDLQALVARIIDAFAALGPEPEGLELAQVAENWRRLLRDADELDVPVSRETMGAAEALIERASAGDEGEESEGEPADLGALEEMDEEELLRLLERRATRAEVALELARRGRLDHLEALFRAARKMSRADLARLLPRLLSYGEGAGDYFVEGLASRKSFTRQACAIALGELKLRRAVVPLVHQMLAEKTPIWSEIARALGRYGTAAIKPLQRYCRDPKGKEERLVRALAFLAASGAGAAKRIEALRSGGDEVIAALAEQALEQRDEVRAIEEAVQGKRAAGEQAPYLRFSRRLYKAIAGEEELDEEDLEELDEEDLVEVDEELE